VKIAPTRTTLLLTSAAFALLLHGGNPGAGAQHEPEGATSIHYPRLVHADVPFYPPAAWSAHFGGTVDIAVTIENGDVTNADVKRGRVEAATDKVRNDNPTLRDYLSVPSLENMWTWRFVSEGHTTFVVTYSYHIQGTETPSPENPTIVLDLPRTVTVTVRPSKPTVTDNLPKSQFHEA